MNHGLLDSCAFDICDVWKSLGTRSFQNGKGLSLKYDNVSILALP